MSNEPKTWVTESRRLRAPGIAELTLVALGVACVLYPAWRTYEGDREQRIEQARIALATTAETTAEAISAWTREASLRTLWTAGQPETVAVLHELAKRSDPEDADESAAIKRVQEVAAVGRDGTAPTFDALLVADPSGSILASSLSSQVGARLAPDAIADANRGLVHVGDWGGLVPGQPSDGSPRWGFVAAVEAAGGPPAGYLALGVDTKRAVERILAGRALGTNGRTRVYSSSAGWLAATSSQGLATDECADSPETVFRRALEAGAKTGYEDCRGTAVLGDFQREPTTGLTVLSEIPTVSIGRSGANFALTAGAAVLLGFGLLLLVLTQTSEGRTAAPETPVRPVRQNTAAWTILAVCLLATFASWRTAAVRVEQQQVRQDATAAKDLRIELNRQLAQRSLVLSSLAAAADLFGPGRSEEWLRLVRATADSERYPGLECVTLVVRSPDRIRLDAGTPCSDGGRVCRGCSDLDEAVARIEAGERRAIVQSELSPEDALLVEAAPDAGRWGPEQRVFVAARIDIGDWAAAAHSARGPGADFVLIRAGDPGRPLYSSTPGLRPIDAESAASVDMSIDGLPIHLHARADDDEASSVIGDYPTQVLLAGLAISVLLFDIALVLSSTRARAMGIAELMSQRYQEGEARVRAVIDNAPDGIITFDGSGQVATLNPSARRIFGLDSDSPKPHIEDLIPVCTPVEAARLARAGSDEPYACEGMRMDGSAFPADLRVSVIREDGRTLFTAIVRDVTARREAEDRLRESEERYALAARGANDGLWDWDLKANRVYFSARWRAMLGIPPEDEVLEDPDEWISRVHPDDVLNLRAQLAAHLDGRAPHFECEYRIRHADGSYRWALSRGIAVRDGLGKASRIAGSQTDITDRKRAERQLRYEALHDPLTGLPNRNYFTSQVEKARRRSASGQGTFALMFLDVDRFKVINDSLGHVVGDQLLVGLADRLTRCLRPGDTICRLGGDEFAILVERLHDVSDAVRIAERIQQDLTRPVEVDERAMYANVSIGIALSEAGRETSEALLRHADLAMYRAKARGKARYELFDKQMHHRAVDRLQLETDLRVAIDNGELILEYQPILDVPAGEPRSCEALIRWRHPRRGVIRPSEFISIAEESGTIGPITSWVVNEACRQTREWLDRGLDPLRVSVNISPSQLLQQDLYYMVMDALTRFELSPEALQLELTEGALLESNEATLNPLRELRDCGVRILLDDFGTGFSSLVYLHGFPIDMIKVDRSFVQKLPEDQTSANITAGLIALAHNLQLGVVAEGAETQEQLDFLVEHSCDEVQGFIIGRPQPPSALEEFLQSAVGRARPRSASRGA